MKLNKHSEGIVDVPTWKKERLPKKGEIQWCEGRSAKELAKYITGALPCLAPEIEDALCSIMPSDTVFDWDAEYVTALPGKGEGRNHDCILHSKDFVVTIEAKADETFGRLIEEEMKGASVNKLYRISKLLGYLFDGNFKDYKKLRYQLLTAAAGTILEAKNKNTDSAVMLVLVFEKDGKVTEEKLKANREDAERFLEATGAYDESGFKVIPNKAGIKLYFKEIHVR